MQNKKILFLLPLLLFLNFGNLLASDPPHQHLTPELFENGEVLLLANSSPWFYKGGDDTSWASPDFIREQFIHSNWSDTDHLWQLEQLPVFMPGGFRADGNVWFFKEFVVDSSLFGQTFAITGKIHGGLEIYLNGQKVGSAGVVSDSAEGEEPKGNFLPILFEWDDTNRQYIAVRYSYHTLRKAGLGYDMLGLSFHIGYQDDVKRFFEERAAQLSRAFVAQSFSAGASAVLGVLLLFMFLMYPRQKQNLIAALLFLSIALGSAGLLIYHTIWELPQSYPGIFFFNALSIAISAFINVWFAQTLTKRKYNWILWTFGIVSVIFIIVIFFNAFLVNDFAMIYWTISMIYVIVHFLRSRIKHGMKDLDIILIGLAIYLLAFIVMITMLMTGQLERGAFIWLSVISLLVPVSYSFYLARDVARTNDLLSKKLDENQRLADAKLKEEQKNRELIENQRAKLEEEVKERTAELSEAYKNLQKSHEDLKNTQKQLVQQEKMASLGQLTAGIAHEIKNPLNFVNNFSEVSLELIEEAREEVKKAGNITGQDNSPLSRGAGGVSDEAEGGDQPRNSDKDSNSANTPLNPLSRGEDEESPKINLILEILNDIEANIATINKHGKRADSIVQGMLLHSRGKSGEKMPTDINNLLDEYADLSFHGLRAKDPSFNAEIIKDFDPDLGLVDVVPQDISRAFLNIINNGLQAAFDAIKKEDSSDIVRINIVTRKTDRHAEIRIRDNGPGIPDDVREKIFEPFFTTKPAGEGTGLGLSMTYDIIKAHNGTITIKTEEDKGTEFVITLPLNQD